MSAVFTSGVGSYEYVRRSLERRDERGRILSLNAQPEAGIVGEIGTGLIVFKAEQGDVYVVGMGKSARHVSLHRQ